MKSAGCRGKMKSECYGCTERHLGCHATCESYKKFRETMDEINEARARERKKQDDVIHRKRRKPK